MIYIHVYVINSLGTEDGRNIDEVNLKSKSPGAGLGFRVSGALGRGRGRVIILKTWTVKWYKIERVLVHYLEQFVT